MAQTSIPNMKNGKKKNRKHEKKPKESNRNESIKSLVLLVNPQIKNMW